MPKLAVLAAFEAACSTSGLHKGLHTYRTLEIVQVPAKQKRRFAALSQSPLTDSNRRPPPYHAEVVANGGNL
jgi:hypothetical protein